MTPGATDQPPPEGSFFRRARGVRPSEPVGPSGLAPGRVLGDFRLERKLGEGGMGQVWRATQLSLGRPVALKLLPSERAISDMQLALFEREARAGGRLHHPSIVAVLAYGEADGLPYIAQELIGDGWSLADAIREARGESELPADWYRQLAGFFATAADALAVAHAAGVIHRDIKPQNILIAEDDRPVIADFGLARVTGVETISRSGDVAGTYAYMSPEQALARRTDIDHRADVYALGGTLYEALTLRRVVEGDTHQQILENILYTDPPPPRAVRSKVPADLSVITMKALEKRRADRYQTMPDFAADLRRWLGNELIQAQSPGVAKRAQKWVLRHPTASAVLGIALVSAIVLAWLTGQLSSALGREQSLTTTLTDRNVELGAALERESSALADAQEQRALAEGNAARARANEERAEENAAAATANAERARREQANVLRLSAFQELQDLQRDANALWPATPDRLPAYDAWLLRATALVAGLAPSPDGDDQGHLAQLAALRARALPRTEEQRQAERVAHPRYAELQQMEAQIAGAEAAVATFRAGLGGGEPKGDDATRRAAIEAKVAAIEAKVAAARKARDTLDAEIDERRAFDFAAEQDTWWHNQLVELIDAIGAFADPASGLIAGLSPEFGWGVARRREFAATVEERTLTGAEARLRWGAASASIADRAQCPLYDGLQLAPQLGLLPIGADPASGLWEFWHVMSGDEPVRGSDGKLVLTEQMGIVLVLIPGGTFWMGAQSTDAEGRNFDPGAIGNEGPVREVTLSPYLLSKYELTQGQWQRFTGRNPSQYGPDRYDTSWNDAGHGWSGLHPVEQVSWRDCVQTLFRLGLVLPSAAQWERACRAGTSTVYWSGNEKEALQGVANLSDQYGRDHGNSNWETWEPWLDDGQTVHAQVGSYRANGFGLHDVHGNVWECCLDGYEDRIDRQGAVQDPMSDIPNRISRGGSFADTASNARSANRGVNTPDVRDGNLGLRPARGIAP